MAKKSVKIIPKLMKNPQHKYKWPTTDSFKYIYVKKRLCRYYTESLLVGFTTGVSCVHGVNN